MRPQDEARLGQRIRERAFQIWEEEGRPHSREKEHWELTKIHHRPTGWSGFDSRADNRAARPGAHRGHRGHRGHRETKVSFRRWWTKEKGCHRQSGAELMAASFTRLPCSAQTQTPASCLRFKVLSLCAP
jgi:hypothetical protein